MLGTNPALVPGLAGGSRLECGILRSLQGSIVGVGERLDQRGEPQGMCREKVGPGRQSPVVPGARATATAAKQGGRATTGLSCWATQMQGAWATDILTSGGVTPRTHIWQAEFIVHSFIHSFHDLVFTEHLQECQALSWALKFQCEQDRRGLLPF